MKHIITVLFIITNFILHSQNTRHIFDSTTIFHYEAIFINKLGDTLSNENVIMKPAGKTWKYDSDQDLISYHYNSNDSIISKFRNPTVKKNQSNQIHYFPSEETGVIETDSTIWLHPFRSNQYLYTEIAPFPQINFNKLKIGVKYTGGIMFVLSGWGKFKGRIKNEYEVTEKQDYKLSNQIITDCWTINGVGTHNKLGVSKIQYLFKEDIGFLKFEYTTFDGNKIYFYLKKIEKI
jgi:hypothetical protein